MKNYRPLFRKLTSQGQKGSGSVLHSLSDTEISEREWLLNIISTNDEFDLFFNQSVKKELLHFVSFVQTMVMAFFAGLWVRWAVRRNKRLNHILQFRELLQVRNNIEKGSFAYDTLLFRQPAFRILQNKSHLANLVCLAILFGDEFIDGIAVNYGKRNIVALLQNDAINHDLQYRDTENGLELFYPFDIRDLLPRHVLDATNEKYGITYHDFYNHLLFLLSEMNMNLNKLDRVTAAKSAVLICRVCNKCFDTYKMDIADFDPTYLLGHLLEYHQKKDDDIIHVLLELRAVLLKKDLASYRPKFSSWSTMVRSMQVYDDMQDVESDCNYQMNFVCYFARNYFPGEWNWLQEHTDLLHLTPGVQKHLLINLYMPGSVILSMQYAKNITTGNLKWVQKKITCYLWKKNWFGWNNPLLNNKNDPFSMLRDSNTLTIQKKLEIMQATIFAVKDSLVSNDMRYAHIIDTAFLDNQLKADLFISMNRTDRYFLKNAFFDFPLHRKAALARIWLLKHGQDMEAAR